MPVDPELLEPYERLIPVTVEGKPVEVPANNTLLRVLQYLDFDLYPCRLCWNGECDNCAFTYLDPESQTEVCARGCETTVPEGMCITRVPRDAGRPRSFTADPATSPDTASEHAVAVGAAAAPPPGTA